MPSPDLLFQRYKEECDIAYTEGTMFILTLHPCLGGHRAPMQHLDGLITYIQSKPGVWFTTCGELAAFVKTAPRSNQPAPDICHPPHLTNPTPVPPPRRRS